MPWSPLHSRLSHNTSSSSNFFPAERLRDFILQIAHAVTPTFTASGITTSPVARHIRCGMCPPNYVTSRLQADCPQRGCKSHRHITALILVGPRQFARRTGCARKFIQVSSRAGAAPKRSSGGSPAADVCATRPPLHQRRGAEPRTMVHSFSFASSRRAIAAHSLAGSSRRYAFQCCTACIFRFPA